MKKIISILVLVFAFTQLFATETPNNNTIESINNFTEISATKDIRTDTIVVRGNCNMCKSRIENAGLIKGVKRIIWDKKTDQTIVIYDATKTTIEKVKKAIAEAGHDTDTFKTDDEVYNALPNCCKYRGNSSNKH